MKGECEVLKERERSKDKECKELKSKCEDAMEDFDKNHAVMILRQKIVSLLAEVKEHKDSVDRMLLESQKWAGYQENLANLESKVAALEAEKGKLEAIEALLRKEIKALKCNRAEVVSKVVPYVAMELVHSDEMAMLFGKFVSFAIFYGRCAAFEEVANMKEPFDLAKVKGYRPTYKKEHMKDGNGLAADTFPFLLEVVADYFASVKAFLSKKPKSLRHPIPTKTHAPAPSAPSQKATPSPLISSLSIKPKILKLI
ncbi:hypothetical protein Tco_0939220 [Tanacetum coccineum]|uniref:FRIGIDA-like protein n=1 Tax=Tanacetum coccineum TaxID=301880 RepID=A0ABQ5DK10_9ASTR